MTSVSYGRRPVAGGGDALANAVASPLAVVIASAGRPTDVAMLLDVLASQTRIPDLVVLAVADERDAPSLSGRALPIRIVLSERGSSKQRNRGVAVAAAAGCGLVVFFDDDFLPADDYLERVDEVLRAEPDLLAVDGLVLADGASGPGLDWDRAGEILRAAEPASDGVIFDQPDGLYGCNMCVRVAAFRAELFDEGLPLYGWLEDRDLSQRLSRRGRVGRVRAARGVHIGVKRGRTSGLRMGYSQIANPVHLFRKRTFTLGAAARHLLCRPLGNAWGVLKTDPHVDRVGRLRGNLIGFRDLFLGRLSPGRILDL